MARRQRAARGGGGDADGAATAARVGTLRGEPPSEVYIGEAVGWRPLGRMVGAAVLQMRGRFHASIAFDAGPVPGCGRKGPAAADAAEAQPPQPDLFPHHDPAGPAPALLEERAKHARHDD